MYVYNMLSSLLLLGMCFAYSVYTSVLYEGTKKHDEMVDILDHLHQYVCQL